MRLTRFITAACCVSVASTLAVGAEPANVADALREIDPNVLDASERDKHRSMWPDDLKRRRAEANERNVAEWKLLDSLADWQRYRDERLKRLAKSLGDIERPPSLEIHTTKTIGGDGFRIHNILFNSRPGQWITANLYEPSESGAARTGILICHSHHTPKTHGELQDMGMTWARLGCVVLVMDQIGHGERRTHPFDSADGYPSEFRVSRQDYYFRYDNGIQFHLAGESLIGQIVHDLRRGVDLLTARPDVDPSKIVLLGSVAGGGDPAAVAAALDARIAVAVPFNFGGPQPETRYPLPDDAESAFNYFGSGSWESTRNLRRSVADGFAPWLIVGGVAPRRLIYAHEFAWDRERDPVWQRLNQIYAWHGEADGLDWVHGYGNVRLSSAEASHCTHIGRHHRQRIHAALARWLGITNGVEAEYSNRRDAAELICWTAELREQLQPRPLNEVLRDAAMRRKAENLTADLSDRRESLRSAWQRALGNIEPSAARLDHARHSKVAESAVSVEHVLLSTETGIVVPLLLLNPNPTDQPVPCVVGVSQVGKERFLRERAAEIASLLEKRIAVCLIDVRGTGETRPDSGRDRGSYATSLSSSELMFGDTTVGARLRDVRAVLNWLRSRQDIAADRIAIWGDSVAPTNSFDANLAVPHGIDGRPKQSEPLGGLLALLAALFDDRIRAVYVHGGLLSFADVLNSPFVTIPHDAVVSGAIPAGDLPGIAHAVSPTPVAVRRLVDGGNHPTAHRQVGKLWNGPGESRVYAATDDESIADWLEKQLR